MGIYTYQESSGAKKAASAERQGVGSSGGNVARMFSRPSPDCVKPPGSPLWTLIAPGIEAAAEGGIPCHNALTGVYGQRNAFIAGSAGWALTHGTGSATMDTDIYMCDGSICPTPQSLRLIGGAGAQPTAVSPVSLNVAAIDTLRLRVWVRNDDGAASDLECAAYSSRAAKWWNGAAFGDAVPAFFNLAHIAGDETDFLLHELAIDKGVTVSPDTLQLTLRQNANGKTSHVGYASFDAVGGDVLGRSLTRRYPSGPPFPQDAVGVAGTRAVPIVRLHSEAGMCVPDAGTIFVTVEPDFVSNCEGNGSMPFLQLGDLAATRPPYLWGHYWAEIGAPLGEQKLRIVYNTGGGATDYSVLMSGVVTSPWQIALVYQGASRYRVASEARTLSVYINGVLLGTTPLGADLFSAAACKDAWIGASDSVSPFCWSGTVRDFAFSPHVCPPAQIAARAAL